MAQSVIDCEETQAGDVVEPSVDPGWPVKKQVSSEWCFHGYDVTCAMLANIMKSCVTSFVLSKRQGNAKTFENMKALIRPTISR